MSVLLKLINPDGVETRKHHHLKRRKYFSKVEFTTPIDPAVADKQLFNISFQCVSQQCTKKLKAITGFPFS